MIQHSVVNGYQWLRNNDRNHLLSLWGSDVISFSTLKKDDFGDLLPTGYNLDIDSSLAVHELGSAVRVRVRGT